MNGPWRLPGYTEVDTLGEGGFGRVALAKHDQSGQFVAIKYLRADLLARPEIAESFRREARLLHTVYSPHVTRLYDYVETPEGAALVMEAVPGVSLKALLAAEGALAPESALAVLKGSLLGLGAAHAAGVVHRDYKPGNVLVTERRESKLVDFGLAILNGEEGLAAGSPAYMAPEQWAGHPGTPTTDVYAATCVFFQCVTGNRPFEASSTEQFKELHELAPVPYAGVPEPLWPLIARGMAKDPAWRPATADAFVAELEATARAAYGEDWEDRGWQRLAAAAGALVALTPLALLATAGVAGVAGVAGTPIAVGGGFFGAAAAKVTGALLAVAALVTATVVVLTQQGDEDDPPPRQVALEVTVETLTQRESDPPLGVDAQFVRVAGHPDAAVEERINAALRAPVDEYVESSRESADSSEADLERRDDFAEARVAASVTMNTTDLLSVRYDMRFASSHATEWQTGGATVNLDPGNGTAFGPEDFFRSSVRTREGTDRLADVLLPYAPEPCPAPGGGERGITPDLERVAPTGQGMDFIVRYRDVGCGYGGSWEVVTAPYRDLEGLLKPEWFRALTAASSSPAPPSATSEPGATTASTPSASPSSPPATEYPTYTDERFGFTCPVPPGFTEHQRDGTTVFTDPASEATLTLRGANNPEGRSAGELMAAAVAEVEATGGRTTHESADGQHFTVSGYLADGRIFYERTHVGTGSTAGLRWVYPRTHKEALDAAVTKTAEEFQPGALDDPH